ncbi:hypothetical protein [Stagnihabitans tardus]|uniref:Uncharacterized protein n=1 Tax=Stagnihabitans tardus TaxID=2699202 RepID=A0AAE5BUU4_9RHOB|nr:hypothetical protein [Stagnihabitans tardus]NBZ86493.1 hypothetical protein [Stagnihabitans tardus]
MPETTPDPAAVAYWSKPYGLTKKRGTRADPIRDCLLDRQALRDFIMGPLFRDETAYAIAGRINAWVREAMKAALPEGRYEAWCAAHMGGELLSPISHTSIANLLKMPDGKEMKWDARVVYAIYRATTVDLSAARLFTPRFGTDQRVHHVRFEAHSPPVNDPTSSHVHALSPAFFAIQRRAVQMIFPERPRGSTSGDTEGPRSWSVRLALPEARFSVLAPMEQSFGQGDFVTEPETRWARSMEFQQDVPRPCELRAWAIVPVPDDRASGPQTLNGTVLSHEGEPASPWFHVKVHTPEVFLAFRLSADIDHIDLSHIAVPDTTQHVMRDLLRRAFIAEDLRPAIPLPDGHISLATSVLRLSGPAEEASEPEKGNA